MADLQALLYVSSAVAPLDDAALMHLLQRARERNVQEQVTGVLLYSDGAFMQYLEGPAAGLERIYRIICDDPQHHGIIEVLREPVARREFALWAMAFRAPQAVDAPGAADDDAALTQLLATGPGPTTGARLLLSKFWQRANSTRWR